MAILLRQPICHREATTRRQQNCARPGREEPEGMPQIKAIVETALYVDDMPRAREFYEALGLRLLRADERMCAFDVGGCSILLLFTRGSTLTTISMPGGTIPPHDGHGPLHIAFAVAADDLPA